MQKIPNHIAFIVDGNRRWAKKRGLSTLKGHSRGFDLIKKVTRWCVNREVEYTTFYVFSTENWNRQKQEIDYLMGRLFTGRLFSKDVKEFNHLGARILFSGRRRGLAKNLQDRIKNAEYATKNNKKITVVFCLNYGGRAEIVDMAKRFLRRKVEAGRISEEFVGDNLYLRGVPDPDLMIRTGGEKRLSNFLLWQSSYSELYFIKKYWPDFNEKDLNKALKEFSRRKKRYGR